MRSSTTRPTREACWSDTRLLLGWQGVGSGHLPGWRRTRKLEDFGRALEHLSAWIFEATEPTKATLTTEPMPFEMTTDCNVSPCFGSLCQIGRTASLRRSKTESKHAKDRDAVVAKKSKRSTDVDTDRNSTQPVWEKPGDKTGRIYLTRRLAQCEVADSEGHNQDKRVMAQGNELAPERHHVPHAIQVRTRRLISCSPCQRLP